MLHFIAFLEFVIAVVGMHPSNRTIVSRLILVFALGLALGLSSSGFPGWPVAIILLLTAVSPRSSGLSDTQGAWSILVVILAHLAFGGFTRPILCVGFLHIVTFAFDLAVFIVALTYPPYINGCSTSTSKGCQIERAAIGLDGVLW